MALQEEVIEVPEGLAGHEDSEIMVTEVTDEFKVEVELHQE